MDGVDAALIETDGELFVRPLAFHALDYSEQDRAMLRQAMADALAMDMPRVTPTIEKAEALIDQRHSQAIRELLSNNGIAAEHVAVVGYHGQTIAHRPERGWTWQIGNGNWLSNTLKMSVVDDFRTMDVQAGGQGAPLVPAYHRALLSQAPLPALVLNLGGVANITFIGRDGGLIAFDTGPANALVDDWVRMQADVAYDEGGRIAAAGSIDSNALQNLMSNSWFAEPPPKSLDRNAFSIAPVQHLSLADGAATLTAFTAAAVAAALAHCPEKPSAIHVAGGGRHNPIMMAMIAKHCQLPVYSVDKLGWNGDATEAEAFAYLAVRVLRGKPTSYPGTTGVRHPISGGRIHDQSMARDGPISAKG